MVVALRVGESMSPGTVLALALTVVCAGACGSPSPTGDDADAGPGVPPGTFEWTTGGQTLTATATEVGVGVVTVGYQIGTATDGSSFTFSIQGTQFGTTFDMFVLAGSFAATVPPPAGHYRIVGAAADRQFSGLLTSAGASGMSNVIFSQSGETVLTRSAVGDVEGTFTMQTTSATTVTGRFNVGCLTASNTGFRCGPASMDAGGTCADLLACCAAGDPRCPPLYSAAMPNGDAACVRVLSVYRSLFCP